MGISILVLAALAPFMILVAVSIIVASGRPVLFRQERVGLDGRLFRIFKFRTMRAGSANALPITGRRDPRVTGVGRVLRATKIDEVPQFLNVLRGEMSLVGPRPEVPRYVAGYTEAQLRVLDARPGLTDPASVLFRNEEDLLGGVEESLRERFYLEALLPRKLAISLHYIERASLSHDLRCLLATVRAVLSPVAGPRRGE